jgi:hypothetical protein
VSGIVRSIPGSTKTSISYFGAIPNASSPAGQGAKP